MRDGIRDRIRARKQNSRILPCNHALDFSSFVNIRSPLRSLINSPRRHRPSEFFSLVLSGAQIGRERDRERERFNLTMLTQPDSAGPTSLDLMVE